MALFKFRKGKTGDETVASAVPAESIDALRRRARHRLIGAVVLVLAGVIGFPLLFDTQPRPIAVDIPIQIPDRNKVKPLPAPAASPAAAGPITPAPPAAKPVAATPQPEPKPEPKPVVATAAPKPEPRPEPKPEPRPEVKPKPEPRPEPRPKPDTRAAARDADGAKARALLEGRTFEAAEAGRFVVQVGAFTDAAKAREARQKLERAGLKTYTHVAETRDGKRIRVRTGPYPSRAEADRAADKVKGLDLPAAILSL